MDQRFDNNQQKFRWANVVIGLVITFSTVIAIYSVILIVTYFREQSWGKLASCNKLLSETATQQLLNDNTDLVSKVGNAGGFHVMVMPRNDCLLKAEISIFYSQTSQGVKIRKILGDTFLGAPYRLINM